MNILKNIKIYILLFAGLFMTNACSDDITELNINPNKPTEVSASILFPGAMRDAVKRVHGHTTRLQRLGLDGGMLWVQYFARNQYTNEGDTYFTVADMMNANWLGFYTESLVNFQGIVNISQEEGTSPNPNFEAVGMIARAWVCSVVTDTWGPIPYTDAVKGFTDNILSPTYDSQESVYANLLEELKVASLQLDPAGMAVSGDILFGGDIMAWKKFANSLRLRLANRQYSKKPSESAAIFSEILGNPAQYPIFESNADNAALVHEGRPSNNPWHEIMVFSGREDWSISSTLIDAMTDGNGNPTDPRITVYAEPATAGDMAGKFSGAINGLPEAAASIFINGASRPGSYFMQETAPVAIMTYSELQFILAEAAAEGRYTGGLSASDYMAEAVEASFNQYNLTMPTDYLSSMVADKETIMTEKWKALFGQGIESWTEMRRTGLPVLPTASPNAIFEQGSIPSRLQYPSTEYSLNGANVAQGVSLLGGSDDKLTPMWWVE